MMAALPMASRGGERDGAGRPRSQHRLLVKVPAGYRLPRWLIDRLRQDDRPAGVLIEEALTRAYGWEPPVFDERLKGD
jgi:hypothetical protein